MPATRYLAAILLTTIVTVSANAGRLFLVPQGTDPSEADATAGSNFLVTAGIHDVLIFDVYLQDQEEAINGFEVAFPCDGIAEFNWPTPMRYVPLNIFQNTDRRDYVFSDVIHFPVIDTGQCQPNIACESNAGCNANSQCTGGECTISVPRLGGVLFNEPAVAFNDETRYLGEIHYQVPATAWGTTVIKPVCCFDDMDCDGVTDDGCSQPLTTLLVDGFGVDSPSVDGVEITVAPPLQIAHTTDPSNQTAPFSGYIDPRAELDTDGNRQGITSTTMRFSQPIYGTPTQDPITPANFSISTTGGTTPTITHIEILEANQTIVRLNFNQPIPLQHWTTVVADVFDMNGTPIESRGSLGESGNEPDRVDLAALPGDIDQDGTADPRDVFQFRSLVNAEEPPLEGDIEQFTDIDRNGVLNPIDLFRLRQVLLGIDLASQPWANQSLLATRP